MTAATSSKRTPIAPTRPVGGAQARAERTRALIMDETVRCVVAEGFAGASAKHIAERAGVTWGVIQYHFGDRDGLLAAVVDAGFDELRARMATVDVPQGSSRKQVTALVDAAWAAFSTPTSRASLEILVATRARRDQATNVHLVAMAGQLTRLGRDLIGDRRHVGDATAIGDLLWATLRGLVLTQMVVNEPVDSKRERAALVDLLVVRLDADPPTRRRRSTKGSASG
jgi:TetR/AcrR family transcriptional regulator, regulator of cefoperazone and chloramphenicol sensitivity